MKWTFSMRWKWSGRTDRRANGTRVKCGASWRKLAGFRLARTRLLTIMTGPPPDQLGSKRSCGADGEQAEAACRRRDGFAQVDGEPDRTRSRLRRNTVALVRLRT